MHSNRANSTEVENKGLQEMPAEGTSEGDKWSTVTKGSEGQSQKKPVLECIAQQDNKSILTYTVMCSGAKGTAQRQRACLAYAQPGVRSSALSQG